MMRLIIEILSLQIIKLTMIVSSILKFSAKALEIIIKVAQKLPNINFHLFGNQDTIYNKEIKKLKMLFLKDILVTQS